MAVIGIANGNTAVYNPYQQNKASNKGKAGTFGDTYLYGENAAVQASSMIPVNKDVDPAKVDPGNASYAMYLDNMRVRHMEVHMTSGILGFGGMEDGMNFSAKYADDSTADNPIVEVRVRDKTGAEKVVRVDVKKVDPTNATQLEMFALLAHQDAQKNAGGTLMESYHDLIYRAQNSSNGDMSAKNAQDFMSWRQNWRNLTLTSSEYDMSAQEALRQTRAAAADGVPYSYLAKDGIIDYKGVIFVCDTKNKALRLGDTSDPKKCLTIGLSGGGSLIVNRDNLGDLAKAIGMFSPEDVNLILRAIAEDAKVQQMKQQIDDETSGLDIAENTGEQETEEN